MNGDFPAYGLWFLVAVNAGIFILFAFSFFKPKTARDWRTLAAFRPSSRVFPEPPEMPREMPIRSAEEFFASIDNLTLSEGVRR